MGGVRDGRLAEGVAGEDESRDLGGAGSGLKKEKEDLCQLEWDES